MKSLSRFGAITIFIVVTAILMLAVSVEAGPTVTKRSSASQQAAASAYWTRARIAAAPAMQMPVDYGLGGVDTAALVEEEAFTGPEGSSPAGMADPDANQIAREAYAEDWEALEEQQADVEAGTRNVFTYYDVGTQAAFYNIYPHRWVGKLTFMTPSGGSSCSATVINNNHIVTAAHCVYDTTLNRFYTNWVFTPAYRNGSAPYGTFAWSSATVLTAWVNLGGAYSINTWARYDVAVIGLRPNSAGRTINQQVGFAGRLWNAPYTQLNFNSGYPGRTYTDALITNGAAQYLRACTNESFQQTTETLGGGCYWGRGISGGSWLVNYKPFVVSGYVNSVNSGLFLGVPNLYGARFNSNNIVLLCNTEGC